MFDPEIGARLKKIRRHLDITGVSIAQKMGVSNSYYSSVERGVKKPSVEMLQGIARHYPQYNLRWLLCGVGVMLYTESDSEYPDASSYPSVPATQEDVESWPPPDSLSGLPTEDPTVDELRELRELASRSSQATSRAILAALGEAGCPLQRQELAVICRSTPLALGPDIRFLKKLGLIREDLSGLHPTGWKLRASNLADSAMLAIQAVDTLLGRILPAAEMGDGSGRLIVAEGTIADGQGLIREIRDLIQRRLSSDEGGEQITLVLGISMEGNKG